jgi:hypothetical protein
LTLDTEDLKTTTTIVPNFEEFPKLILNGKEKELGKRILNILHLLKDHPFPGHTPRPKQVPRKNSKEQKKDSPKNGNFIFIFLFLETEFSLQDLLPL